MVNEKPLVKNRWRIRNGERQLVLLFGDLLAGYLSILLGLYFWAQKDWLDFSWAFLNQRAPFWFYLLPLLWIVFLLEIYDVRKANRRPDVIRGVITAAGIGIVFYLIVFFISEPNSLPRRGVLIFILAVFLLTILWRLLYIRIFTAPVFLRRVLMIGAGMAGTTLAQMFSEIHPAPFILVGYIDDDPGKQGQTLSEFPVLGDALKLEELIEQYAITDLIFAISGDVQPQTFREILRAEEQGIEVTSLPAVYEDLFHRVPIKLLQSDWVLRSFIDQSHTGGLFEVLKRLIDILGAMTGMIGLAILFPFIAICILIDSGRPLLYSQMRVGKNGRPYKMYKFRTMVADADKDGVARTAVENDQRVTRFGKLLRKSHLDELPQIFSILKGESSIVGPRPEQIELVNQFQEKIPFYRARLFVRPGLTGWAQINQRYASTIEDMAVKLEYDLYYIKHRNLLLDLTIILRTVGAVLGFRGL